MSTGPRLAGHFVRENFDVEFFTNGAFDDTSFANDVLNAVIQSGLDPTCVTLAERGTRPKDLARTISSYDAIIAHRLHANIIAYAYEIPHVGIGWDNKMQGYFAATGRSKYLVTCISVSEADSICELILAAMEEPISPDAINTIKDEIYDQAAQAINTLIKLDVSN